MITLVKNGISRVAMTLSENDDTGATEFAMDITNLYSRETISGIAISDVNTDVSRYNGFSIVVSDANDVTYSEDTTLAPGVYLFRGTVTVTEGATLYVSDGAYVICREITGNYSGLGDYGYVIITAPPQPDPADVKRLNERIEKQRQYLEFLNSEIDKLDPDAPDYDSVRESYETEIALNEIKKAEYEAELAALYPPAFDGEWETLSAEKLDGYTIEAYAPITLIYGVTPGTYSYSVGNADGKVLETGVMKVDGDDAKAEEYEPNK